MRPASRPRLDRSGLACGCPRAPRRAARACFQSERKMHRYRTHTCGELREARYRRGRAPLRLVPPHPRSWRRAVHRSARPLRHDPMRGRPGFAGLQPRRDAALRMGRADRRASAEAPAGHRESRTADRAGRGLRDRDRGARAGRRTAAAGRSAISNTRRRRASNTASSICAATSCTPTSCCAGR